jgi:hypothetical protein
MAYWLDEGWHSWSEIVRAGTAAAGLYSRCGSWIADQTADGLVPVEVARMYGTAEWAQRLVDVGLWRIEDGGYRDLRYFPLNPSSEVVQKRREQAADRQRRLRDRRNAKPPRESRVTNTVNTAVTSQPPTLPPPLTGRAGDAPASPGGARPLDPYVDGDDPTELAAYHAEMAALAEQRTRDLDAEQRRRRDGAARARAVLADKPKPPLRRDGITELRAVTDLPDESRTA